MARTRPANRRRGPVVSGLHAECIDLVHRDQRPGVPRVGSR